MTTLQIRINVFTVALVFQIKLGARKNVYRQILNFLKLFTEMALRNISKGTWFLKILPIILMISLF